MKKSKSQMKRESVLRTGQLPSHCVQCGEMMIYGTDWDKFVPVCNNPECPNYGLLQMGAEKMAELERSRN